jgi:histidine triad (HIT) family protein
LTDNCVFCEIVKTGDAEEFYRHDKFVVSFVPLNPVTPGHRLFVPARHGDDIADDPTLGTLAVRATADYANANGHDFNLITSGGSFATQTVFHTHIHYVPRRENDGLFLPWTEHWCL